MDNPPTVKVKSTKGKLGWVTMNASDFDPEKDELFDGPVKAPKPEVPAPKGNKLGPYDPGSAASSR